MSTVNPNLSELADGSAYYGNVDVGVRRLAVEDMAQNARLDVLEAMARGYQEDGALALERVQRDAVGDGPRGQIVDMLAAVQHPGYVRADDAYAWKQRAETAERERDEYLESEAMRWGHITVERDALREALVKYGKHTHDCLWLARESGKCDCGLAEALA